MAALRKCCAKCFADRGLERDIIPTLSRETGRCSFCQAERVRLILPAQLADSFAPVVNIYEPHQDGRLLVELLKEDWQLFDPTMSTAAAKELLAEVLDNGEIVRGLFLPSPRYRSDGLAQWEKLRAELMHENRYFPDALLDLNRLRELLSYLQADPIATLWHRARLMTTETLFTPEEMGPPPRRAAGHGRANPAGIPYLYLGSSPETALSEIRPHTGEMACVADFTLPDGLKLVDLRFPRKLVSPFVLADEDAIGTLRSDIDFLERMGEELTRPILPHGALIDYVPSQYLCEFIKKCGYDGVIYRSSMEPNGINLALFNPAVAVASNIRRYEITQVTVQVRMKIN